MIKKLISSVLAVLLLVTCLAALASCSKPPEYAAIEQRFIELVEKSYGINKILFGEGLPTYERVYERTASSYKVHGDYYYYEINDRTHGDILAYRTVALQKDENGKLITEFSYLSLRDKPIEGKTAVYEDASKHIYCYALEGYTEPLYDFYYSVSDPDNYDYVTAQSEYQSVEQIKIAAEQVYSKDYLNASVYEALFTGAAVGEATDMLLARYIEYTNTQDGDNTSSLMQSNTYKALVSETRIFDFSTAKMVKPSSKKLVNIEVETYLESKPDQRTTVRVTMVLQDGQWFLDSGTY